MKRGFTLVELLAVFILLGVLALLAYPQVVSLFKETTEKLTESQEVIIIEQAKSYVSNNQDTFINVDDATYCIEINTLLTNNYLDNNFYNELSDSSKEKKVKVSVFDNSFVYETVDECS